MRHPDDVAGWRGLVSRQTELKCLFGSCYRRRSSRMVALTFCHVHLRGQKPPSTEYPTEIRTLGDHIRKHRLDLGLLQKQVAVQIGTDNTTITNWELGHTSPGFRYFPAIRRFLGYLPISGTGTRADELKVHRFHRGWSQKEAARDLGVDPSTLAKWERGERVPVGQFGELVAEWLANVRSS